MVEEFSKRCKRFDVGWKWFRSVWSVGVVGECSPELLGRLIGSAKSVYRSELMSNVDDCVRECMSVIDS